ncbi:nucleotide sugar dehydrogenase [Fervidibacillus halotolerans]|uniref:Nucleotide sugar dehydrogenase n=1 Tax=Fervidibacillus halotolerans TaxID=2980027 RepID=A0A9E8M293_9BACI|nr:nucleotide sugar dehydrogenase [Fervidibacillus halotolerans]WAA13136.1 nucleotide sugar dehydrogenase [Fervidibacillus halotolerans]
MAKVAIIGLGYVGLPLALLFHKKGHTVYGIDTDKNKINLIKQGKSFISDVESDDLQSIRASNRFHVDSSFSFVKEAETIILCVPTPLTKEGEPNISYIDEAVCSCLPYLNKDQLMILESSTYPGTTEEIIMPKIESRGFIVGKDFYLAYSPERIDPGQKTYLPEEIPKIIGGVTDVCTKKAQSLYRTVFRKIVPVSSPKAAEMAKLIENAQRLINISFINEMAMLCEKMNLDPWEVIEACKTKPFGFTPFEPGIGAGGHCIPVDPVFLRWKAEMIGKRLTMIESAEMINKEMPDYIIHKVTAALNKPLSKSKLFIIGVTYKRDVNDIRESKAIEIIERLVKLGASITYHDPYVPFIHIENHLLHSSTISEEKLKESDCTLILTDHRMLPYEFILKHARKVIDPKNALKKFKSTTPNNSII